MSIFGSIMSKIFQHPTAKAALDAVPASAGAPPPVLPSAMPDTAAPATGASATAASPVDVGAVLEKMAASKGGGGNYGTSIVDLLKMLDLDSSLDARKQLGGELNVHAGADGTAEQNIALHKAVMQKLAANGGKVPDSMRA